MVEAPCRKARRERKGGFVMRQDGGYAIGDKVPMGKAIVYSLQHLMAFVAAALLCPP